MELTTTFYYSAIKLLSVLMLTTIFYYSAITAQFHGSVLRPDLTQNSAKAVLFTMYVPTVDI